MAGVEKRSKVLQNLGSLVLKVWRAEKNSRDSDGGDHMKAPTGMEEGICEQDLKGKQASFRTTLGKAIIKPRRAVVTTVLIDPQYKPRATFVFYYLSKVNRSPFVENS